MDFLAALIKVGGLISQALQNAEKLPAALISGGIVEAVGALALALAIFKTPGGIFQHHGEAPVYMYYDSVKGEGGTTVFLYKVERLPSGVSFPCLVH